MIAIQTICESIANALANSATISAYCTANFGRGLRVCLGSVGSYDEDDEGYAPYVEVFPMDDVEGDIGGETATQAASVCAHVCIDSSVTADTWDDGSKQDRETGVRRARFDSRLFELVNLIRAEVCRDGHGAVYSTQKTTYDGMTAYPVCYASIIADFRQVASW